MKLSDESEFFKLNEIDLENVSIISVSDAGVIIYDTRISHEAVAKKFNGLESLPSTKEEFEKKYFEIKNRRKNENNSNI